MASSQVLQVKGHDYKLSLDDRLIKLSDWTEVVAEALASRDEITLTEDHWEVINVMRDFYHQFNISPVRKLLKKAMAEKYGADKSTDQHLLSLFPNDVLIQGTRVAGIPVPLLDAELELSTYAKSVSPNPEKAVHFIKEFEFEGRQYRVYPRGNLVNPDEWSEKLANHMASKENITLTAEHWEVINFLRRFYFQYGISPMVGLLMKHMREQYSEEKGSAEYLYQLFPSGPSRQGSRIAGLPEPQGCIDP